MTDKSVSSEAADSTRDPKICMPSWSSVFKTAFQCPIYEFQDVISETNDVDLIELNPRKQFKRTEPLFRKLLWRDVTGQMSRLNPGMRTVHLDRDYDIFVAVCQSVWDLFYLNAVKGWKDRCRTSVIWLDELWAEGLLRYRHLLEPLTRFDHICIGLQGTVGPLSELLGREVHWVPQGVDTLRFGPGLHPPERVIDIFSMGRRWPDVHKALLELSQRRELFYMHDTVVGSKMEVLDYRQHRNMLGNIARRSSIFTVNPAKMTAGEGTRGQVEVGMRYYEGCATGAVMLGQGPDCEAFRSQFGWPDAVVEVRSDGSDTPEVVGSLLDDPARMAAIGQRNAREALHRHDWLYRSKEMLKLAGFQPSRAMRAREERLRKIASGAVQPA